MLFENILKYFLIYSKTLLLFIVYSNVETIKNSAFLIALIIHVISYFAKYFSFLFHQIF